MVWDHKAIKTKNGKENRTWYAWFELSVSNFSLFFYMWFSGHLLACWLDAIWGWYCHNLSRISMRDAIYISKRKWERKRSAGILNSGISSSNAWRSKVFVEARDKPWARLSDLGWKGDWTNEENFSYSEKAMSYLLLKCSFHDNTFHCVFFLIEQVSERHHVWKSDSISPTW